MDQPEQAATLAEQAPPSKPDFRAYACILIGASLWGTTGLFNRLLLAGGLTPSSTVVIRNTGGLLVLLLLFALRDRSVFRVRREHLKYFFGTGVISVLLFTACYFSCQRVTSLAVASILLYTAPAMVVLLTALLWKEPITKRKVAAVLLTLLGCTCVTGIWSGSLSVTLWGIALGLGAAFFYALYSIFGRYALNAGYSSMTVTVWTFVFAGTGALFFLRPRELAVVFTQPSMALYAVCLVVLSTVLPYLLYTAGLSKVESGKASIMASMEPVVACLVGVLVFGEPMGVQTVIGVLCVLMGVWILK